MVQRLASGCQLGDKSENPKSMQCPLCRMSGRLGRPFGCHVQQVQHFMTWATRGPGVRLGRHKRLVVSLTFPCLSPTVFTHAVNVLVITQLLSAFCLLASRFMCSWFQMFCLVPDISVLTHWRLGPEHALLCKTFLWIAGCYQDACPLSTGCQEHPLTQGQQLKISRQYPLGVETDSWGH